VRKPLNLAKYSFNLRACSLSLSVVLRLRLRPVRLLTLTVSPSCIMVPHGAALLRRNNKEKGDGPSAMASFSAHALAFAYR
jgi:hypothetical protein